MWSVFFVFLSYLDRNFVEGAFLDADKESKEMFSMINGTLCAKMSTVGQNVLYLVSDGAEAVRSVVSPSGRLVTCTVTGSQTQVKSFMHECRLGLVGQRGGRLPETPFTRMDEAKPMCRAFAEGSGRGGLKPGEGDAPALQSQILKRSKRGFTYPGTLWCGAGNMADNYDQLGDFAQTDSCCRTHDHCPHVIHAFSSNYGHTNFKWHSICHCDCDNADNTWFDAKEFGYWKRFGPLTYNYKRAWLKSCLRKVNDTSSRVVGQAFFNVIGVPCFELTYEEQCAERHWYGVCKRYEKLPIALLQEAVPYDFGGIDVIDQLTLAPPVKKDSEESEKEEKMESTTQSTVSGPGEPSLTNVVTAAEDFIKVLATVSTSQSSSADSDKGETQSSEKNKKKKRKNKGKKKKTTKKQKGKGRKRKQKAETDVKPEEGAAVAPSGRKAGEVAALSHFISESHKHGQSGRNTNQAGDNEYELGGKGRPSNEVMKDEPAMDEDAVSTAPEEIKPSASASPSVVLLPNKPRELRKGRRKKNTRVHTFSSEGLVMNTTDKLSSRSVPSIVTSTAVAQSERQSFGSHAENRPAASANNPAGLPKVKRNRSKERAETEGWKKRRKVSPAPPIVATAHEHSSVDNLKVIPLRVLRVSTTEREVPNKLDIHGGETSIHITGRNSSFSVWKRQRSKEKGQRRRKPALHPSSEVPSFDDISENVPPFVTTPDALNSSATPPVSGPTGKLEMQSEWRLFTTAAPAVATKPHRHTTRQQRKLRKKAAPPAALSHTVSNPEQTEQAPVTFTAPPAKVATADRPVPQMSEKPSVTTWDPPILSPVQLSIQRVRAQLSKKKRRKAALSIRHQ